MIFCGKSFSLELGKKTLVMGILNVTPDSFYDGGKYNSKENAIKRAKQILDEGGDLVDIGAQSTRPGHTPLTEEQELEIIKSYLPYIYNETGALISVDTFFPRVADYALANGAVIVNDVSGKLNPDMAAVVKKHGAGWIIMHTGGGDADLLGEYGQDTVSSVDSFFTDALNFCADFDIRPENILLDPGIGFGKTYEQNLKLIKSCNRFKNHGCGVLMALSSKRVLAQSSGAVGGDLVFPTISADTVAVLFGADMIRVHAVKESVLAAKTADAVISI